MNKRPACDLDLGIVGGSEGASLTGQKRGQMPGDRRILRVRQGHLGKPGAPRGLRQVGDLGFGKKAVSEKLREILAGQFGFDRSTNQG